MALPSGTPYAEGRNFRIEIAQRVAICRVWTNTELSWEQGAECANQKVTVFERLASFPCSVVRAALLDLREAPKRWGPMTHRALSRCAEAMEREARRLALVTLPDPEQRLLVQRLQREAAPKYGELFQDDIAALLWVQTDPPTREPVSV